MNAFASMFIDMAKIADAFRGDGALVLGRPPPVPVLGHRVVLPHRLPRRAPELDRRARRRRRQARGRRHRRRRRLRSRRVGRRARPDRSPKAQFTGFDFHAPSIETARARAEEAGVADRTTFEVADAKSYAGTYDLICFFDCLHDMGDPVGIARYALEHLAEDGTVLLVEPFAIDGRADNIADNPMAALLYTASSSICTPNSLSQEVGLGLGAQAGEARLRAGVRGGGVHAVPARRRDAA